MKNSAFLLVFSVLFFALATVGCGNKYGGYVIVEISGTVAANGKPLPEGFVLTFQPEQGRSSEAVVGPGGAYRAVYSASKAGVQKGPCKAKVSWSPAALGPGGLTPPPVPEEFAPLLEKYGFASEGLPLEIKKKSKEFNIDFEF
ncbi:MAG: hypothetical protein IJE97_00910 [Thermoguttaceae bacterium]|nr:hypothetical protein [Thermoguttaceae bacterium]